MNEAVIVEAELINRPMAFARLMGMSIIEKIGTNPMAEPTPPMEKRVESAKVSRK